MTRIPTGIASGMLAIGPPQLRKLVAAGVLRDVRYPGTAQVRVDLAEVQALAEWPAADPTALEQVEIIVHVGGRFVRPDGSVGGWGTEAGFDGWNRYWPVSDTVADASVGGLLVAAVSGFVPAGAARRIRAWERVPRLGIAFATVGAGAEAKGVERHRIQALPGGVWQRPSL